MSDRADEVAAAAVARFHVLWGVKWYPDARTFDLEKHQTDTGREVEHQVQVIAAALRAYAEEAMLREREAWLNLAAEIEAEIAGDARHTAQEIQGAHMLGASLRAAAAAAAIRARGEGKHDPAA